MSEVLERLFKAYIPETRKIEIEVDDYMSAECTYRVSVSSLFNPSFMPEKIAHFTIMLSALEKVLEKETGYRISFGISYIDGGMIELGAKNETLYNIEIVPSGCRYQDSPFFVRFSLSVSSLCTPDLDALACHELFAILYSQ